MDIPSLLVFGGSSLGGLYEDIDEATALECVRCALQDHRIQAIDTAPHYGCGAAEARLGRILGILKVPPGAVKVFTKVGRVMVPKEDAAALGDLDIEESNRPGSAACVFPGADPSVVPVLDYSAAGMAQSYRDSRARLQGYRIFGLRVHDCDSPARLQALTSGGGIDYLAALRRDEGVHISLGTNSVEYCRRLIEAMPGLLDSVLIANAWNLLQHPAESVELFRKCAKGGIQVQLAGVFASGVLASPLRTSQVRFMYSADIDPTVVTAVAAWAALAGEFRLSLPTVALHFALLPRKLLKSPACPDMQIVVGFRDKCEVDQCVACLVDAVVPSALWRTARERGLLGEHVMEFVYE